MTDMLATQRRNSPLLEQIAIVVVLVLIILLGLMSAYSYLMKAATVTPEEMERQALIKYVNANPQDVKARLGLAFAYQKAGDYTNAQKQYNASLGQSPGEMAAYYNLGVIAKKQQNLGEAEKMFLKVLSMKKSHLLAALGLGEVYIAQGKNDEAIQVLDKILENDGHLTDPRLLKAKAMEGKGDKDGALKEYKTVLKYVPNQQEALAALKRLQ